MSSSTIEPSTNERTNIAISKETRDRISRLGHAISSLESVLKILLDENGKELLQHHHVQRNESTPRGEEEEIY
jgi:hypothetical protein